MFRIPLIVIALFGLLPSVQSTIDDHRQCSAPIVPAISEPIKVRFLQVQHNYVGCGILRYSIALEGVVLHGPLQYERDTALFYITCPEVLNGSVGSIYNVVVEPLYDPEVLGSLLVSPVTDSTAQRFRVLSFTPSYRL